MANRTGGGLESAMSVNCPHCRAPIFWTDIRSQYDEHKAAHPNSELRYIEGVEGGGWKPQVQVEVKGVRAKLIREDLLAYRIYPMVCHHCKKVLVAHLWVKNLEEVEHYERMVRPFRPPLHEGDETRPNWGMVGFPPGDFVKEVNAIGNPVVRDGLVRRLNASRFQFDGLPAPAAPLFQRRRDGG